MYAEILCQSHAGSLVGGSVSVSPYGPRLVDSVGFLVVSLTPLAPTILPAWLLQDSPSSSYCLSVGLCICFHPLLDETSLMPNAPGTNLLI